jgi:hypothetical protein
MDLKDIAAITGKSGLYKVKSKTQNAVIVEEIGNESRKFPVHAHQPLAILDEITIFSTKSDDIPLKDVFAEMKKQYPEELPVTPKDDDEKIRSFFNEVAPDHDSERVYISDIKKTLKWYHLLLQHKLI